MSYKNPILAEIYVEFFLIEPASSNDQLDLVQILKSNGYDNITLPNEIYNLSPPQKTINTKYIRCMNETGDKLIQVSPQVFVMNAIGNYKGKDDFFTFFHSGVNYLKETNLFNSINGLSLNTIDRLDVVLNDNFLFQDYINCEGEIVPKWYKGSIYPIDINYGKGVPGKDEYNKQVKLSGRINDDKYSFELQTLLRFQIEDTTLIENFFNDIYVESNQIFENVITDKVRDIMNK
ncbi:MAG: TIGR04255 family protein [Chitinophagales bacterium]